MATVIIEISLFVLSYCFGRSACKVEWAEYALNITKPTSELCVDLSPPHLFQFVRAEEVFFVMNADWCAVGDLMFNVESLDPAGPLIEGYIAQGRINDVVAGGFRAFKGMAVVDCPPEEQNTLIAISTGDTKIIQFWLAPSNLQPDDSIAIHITVLANDGKFYPISFGVPYVREEVIRAAVEKLLHEDSVPFRTNLKNLINLDNESDCI